MMDGFAISIIIDISIWRQRWWLHDLESQRICISVDLIYLMCRCLHFSLSFPSPPLSIIHSFTILCYKFNQTKWFLFENWYLIYKLIWAAIAASKFADRPINEMCYFNYFHAFMEFTFGNYISQFIMGSPIFQWTYGCMMCVCKTKWLWMYDANVWTMSITGHCSFFFVKNWHSLTRTVINIFFNLFVSG